MIQRSLLRQALHSRPSTALLRSTASPSLQPRLFPFRLPAPAKARIAARWYSDEKSRGETASADESSGASPPKGEEPAVAKEDSSKKELEAKNKEIVDLKDKYLRQVAEFRNLQDRTAREMKSARDFAIQKFARDLIESVDNFDLALSQVSPDKLVNPSESSSPPESPPSEDPYKELRALHGGLRMTETVLMNTLKRHGLERFDPSETGDKFNPNLHEATFQTPQPDKEDGTVFHTTQKGFLLNGRVLRAAKVGVVKNS